MPKTKGGKGKKTKGGKGKKKGGGLEMTWQEALLAYRVNIKETELEDLQYEVNLLQEGVQRNREKNERLLKDQDVYLRNLLDKAHKYEQSMADEKRVEKADVIKQMLEKWDAARKEEKKVTGLREAIVRKDVAITQQEVELHRWQQYRDSGLAEHKRQAELREKELHVMAATYDDMSAHLRRNFEKTRKAIEDRTEFTLDKQKHVATELAMNNMDNHSKQEVWDNEWLQKEVRVHEQECAKLVEEIEALEASNLAVMEELFQCHIDDLKVSRAFFLSQFADKENLEETGFLETDLNSLTFHEKRPKSAMQKYIEEKVHGIPVGYFDSASDDDNVASSQYDDRRTANSDDEDPFSNYLTLRGEQFDNDYLQLGPIELKLLSVTGHSAPLHRIRTPTKEEAEVLRSKPPVWPVKQKMIWQALK